MGKDRSKRDKNGQFSGSEPGPTAVPRPPLPGSMASVGSKTPVGNHLTQKRGNPGNIEQEAFERLMNFLSKFDKDMDRDLVRRLAHIYEVDGADAAKYDHNQSLNAEQARDLNDRLEARSVAWKYAENEARQATGFAQVLISRCDAETSGYIIRDALLATVAKDKISPRIYGILMKAWVSEVGNDDIAYPNKE